MTDQAGDQAFRATNLYGREEEMTFGGALSFLRRKYTRDLSGADVVVSGIPFDSATSNRPGARFGPAAIRAGSVLLAELHAFPSGFDPFDRLAVVDYGDCYIDYGYPQNVVEIVEVAPAYDSAEITAIAAATLAHDYLCLQALKRKPRDV